MNKLKSEQLVKIDQILILLITVALFLLLHAPLFDWWCETRIGQLLSKVQTTFLNDIILFGLIVMGIITAILLSKKLSNKGKKWCRTFAFALIYILIIESFAFNDCFIHFLIIPFFRYSDVLIIVSLSFFIASFFENKEQNNPQEVKIESNGLIYYDDPEAPDFMGRSRLVDLLCKRLTETQWSYKSATGIAITGGWGTGKSWVLEHVKSKLEQLKETHHIICIDFKPWLYGETDMTKLFYQTLECVLKSDGLKIEELRKIISEIDKDELGGFGRAFLSAIGFVTNNSGREKTIQKIKDKLKISNYRIYVFIDDCDRLAHKELLQVLSLIRNTGDFPGLTYIAAFDKEVVQRVIGIENEMGLNYVGKMFNLNIDLPPVNDEIIANYLFESASSFLGRYKEDNNPYLRVSITKYLYTVREAKKYLNLLFTDFKRLEKRFDKYHYHMGDFCLVELLKYKWPDFYYELLSNPFLYLKVNHNGWNSPAVTPIEHKFKEGSDLLPLLQALFRIHEDSVYLYDVIGVANLEYFPLYFENELDVHYVEKNEFNKAFEGTSLPQQINKWLDDDHTGILGLLCSIHNRVSRKDIFLSLCEYLWHCCERMDTTRNLEALKYGYEHNGHDAKHGFMTIMDVIEKTPQIYLLAFQHLTTIDNPEEKQVDSLEILIQSSNYTLELMGIMLNQLKNIPNTDYPYEEVRSYVIMLWNKAADNARNNDALTMDIIDVLRYCSLEDTFQLLALPLIAENPKRWLGATITKLHDEDKEYYLPKNRAVHAIFGSLNKLNEEMKKLVGSVRSEDKDYVEAYFNMISNISSMKANKKAFLNGSQYMNTSSLETKMSPILADSILVGLDDAKPIISAIEDLWEKSFWKGTDLRIHR